MLLSAVVRLRAEQEGVLRGGTGRAVHGFWFSQWRETSPATSERLHSSPGMLPFTLSPLMGFGDACAGRNQGRRRGQCLDAYHCAGGRAGAANGR